MTPRHPTVAVVGAGPAGLTFALAARQAGLFPEVFEQAPDFRRVGGGLLLHGNGQRALLALGLKAAFRPLLRPVDRLEIVLVERGRVFLQDLSAQPPPHDQAGVVMRYALQERLLEAVRQGEVPVHFGRRLAGLSLEAGGPVLRFEDGLEVEAEVVVGADGARSRVRESLGLTARLSHVGQAYLRGIADRPPPTEAAREHLGPDGRRFGIAPLPGNRTYFYCTAPLGRWDQVRRQDLAAWIEGWRPFGEEVLDTLQAVSDWQAVNYDEIREVRLQRWCRPPVFLIGDAAHAMTPDLGQGANSAMVDAVILARLLTQAGHLETGLEEVARRYEQVRRPFVSQVQRLSRQTGRLFSASSPSGRRLLFLSLVLGERLPTLRRRSLDLGTGRNPAETPYLEPEAQSQAA